jgi:hypothetical protein
MGWSAVTVSVPELRRKSIAAPAEVSIASKSRVEGAEASRCSPNVIATETPVEGTGLAGWVVIGLWGWVTKPRRRGGDVPAIPLA